MADSRNWQTKCPNLLKGIYCDVCGSKYVCLEWWRKKRTVDQRKKAYFSAHQKESRK
jgi:hypothetical protein